MPFVPFSFFFFFFRVVMDIVQVGVGLVGVGLADNVGDGLVDWFILVRGRSLKCKGGDLLLWMVSASLSGISMLNSYMIPLVSTRIVGGKRAGIRSWRVSPYLLDSHDHLHGIKAVQSEVVREVCGLGDLRI